jgi:hypothetical protein
MLQYPKAGKISTPDVRSFLEGHAGMSSLLSVLQILVIQKYYRLPVADPTSSRLKIRMPGSSAKGGSVSNSHWFEFF